MRRVGRHQRRPDLRGWWAAALAVTALLFAPLLVSPAHAHGHVSACGMDGSVQPMPAAQTHRRDAACAAACAVCAQLAPARIEPAPAPRARATARVRYPRLELRLSGVEPDWGTPPPR